MGTKVKEDNFTSLDSGGKGNLVREELVFGKLG